ncbi:MAG: type II secretion system secretin GspD [Syntrophorhabdaceae bacterium]|nr:type II secretion system secretin GspD [Syntrophorhabdaceae bacterium]
MKRLTWKLCFAIFSVWLLAAGVVATAAPDPQAGSGANVIVQEELQAPKAASTSVLPAMPEAAPQASAVSAAAPGVEIRDPEDYPAQDSAAVPQAPAAPAPVVIPNASVTPAPAPGAAPQTPTVSIPISGDIPDLESPDYQEPGTPSQNLAVSVPISEGDIQDLEGSGEAPPSGEGGGFFVKFNNANLYEVIHTLAANAGINYTIDPRVKGVVNVHTQGMLQKSSALDLLFTILRVNGATAVKEGDTYHILPMSDARMEPLVPSLAGDKRVRGAPGQVSMRAYPLQHISVGEMATVIKPFLSPAGEAVEVGRANTLLVIDTEANLDKIVRLVELLDSDVFRSAGVKLFKLKTLDPDEMVKNLENIFGALDFSSNGTKPSGINFVSISRLNSVLVVSASPKAMADVERWIEELDRPGGSSSRSVHSYRIRYGKVADIIAVLTYLYPSNTAIVRRAARTEFNPSVSTMSGQSSGFPGPGSQGMGQMQTQPQTQMMQAAPQSAPQYASQYAPQQPARPGGASQLGGRRSRSATGEEEKSFYIIPDEATNSLIIRASLAEYADLLAILKTIDVYPQQVLLEVLVGEVNLSDDMKLGISWQWSGTSGTNQNVNHTVSMMESGFLNNFTYFIEKTNRLTALFKTLAEDGRASILSSPSIIASNGKESTINVVDQIPITTSVLNSATNPPVTTTSVEYRDVGVILRFTPYINDDGLVTMEIEQEVSDVNLGSASVGSNPSFFKRSIATNLVASQDQSIVLGGLVKEKKSLDRAGLPFFYKIPVIGWLFGSREDSLSRNELLIFITPRVIRSVEEGVKLSRDFEDRVTQLKARMEEAKGMRIR